MSILPLVLALLAPQAPAASPETAAVMATVQKFTDGFNKGDAKTAASACADRTSIIDEFPPYVWQGAGACATWMKDFAAWTQKGGVTDAAVTMRKPRHADVAGDRAYVVVPSDIALKVNGKPAGETDSALTIVLKKGAGGWRIIAWSWAKGDEKSE
jgi:ketosteroid isomerase-like protein